MNKSINCPVPEHQLPSHEYNKLASVWDFSWACKSDVMYYKTLSSLFLFTFVFFYTFIHTINVTSLINSWSLLFSSLFTFLICLRTYLGFQYVYSRLLKSTLPYEESSWYDGQIWIKTINVLIKDRLIADYVLLPILHRIKFSLMINLLILLILTVRLFFN